MARLLSVVCNPSRLRALLRAGFDLCLVELWLRTKSLPVICADLGLVLLNVQGADVPTRSNTLPHDADQQHSALPALEDWAVAALARRWPLGGGCLRYALVVASRLPRSPTVRTHLQLGTRRSFEGGFEAHAWLLRGDATYQLKPAREADAFVPLRRSRAS
jgi:hypothetical protein